MLFLISVGLYLTASTTHFKAFARRLYSRNGELVAGNVAFTEINLAQDGFPDKFISEVELGIWHFKRARNILRFVDVD